MEPASEIIIDESSGAQSEIPYLYFSCPILSEELGSASDERKKDICEWNASYDDFLMDIQPICFKWNNKNDCRIHTGFGAQTLKNLLERHGIKNSALVFGQEATEYSVFYSELHAIEVDSIQKNRNKIKELEAKIQELEKIVKIRR